MSQLQPGNVPLIYVAGPVRAASAWERAQNVHRAQECCLQLQLVGAATFCPHVEFGPFTGEWDEHHVMILCKAVIQRCDGIYTVPRWEKSEGTLEELEFARDIGSKLIWHDIHDAITWIQAYQQAWRKI